MRWGCDFIPLSRGTNCIRFSPETRRSAGAPTAIFLWPSLVSASVNPAPKDLVELKARYEDLGKARALLAGAEHAATVRQVDTYFSLGERRLKLRSVVGAKEGQLVYYERPDVGGVKESRVLLASIPDAPAVREILSRVLPVKAEVRKTREIYRFQGVQVHLDTVRGPSLSPGGPLYRSAPFRIRPCPRARGRRAPPRGSDWQSSGGQPWHGNRTLCSPDTGP